MKKLRITVNGKVYEVVVQVLEDDELRVPGATGATPGYTLPSEILRATAQQASSTAAAPTPTQLAAAPLAAVPPAAVPRGVDPNAIAAPLAGTVQKVFVEAGASVEAKTPVVLLDAMKMDTYIYAPRNGHVAEVCVKPGETVQVGTVLIRYRSEA